MFTIKLGTNKTFTATSACEYYRNEQVTGKGAMLLTFESTEVEHPIEWYKEALEEEGAIDTIEVIVDGQISLTASGYTVISDLSLRLLASGMSYLTISLSKPEDTV